MHNLTGISHFESDTDPIQVRVYIHSKLYSSKLYISFLAFFWRHCTQQNCRLAHKDRPICEAVCFLKLHT